MAGLKFQSNSASGWRSRKQASLMRRCEAAFAAQAGLIGEQAMEEVQVRQTGVLGLLEGGVELVGRHGDAQGREVGEDFVTPARRRGGSWRFFLDGFIAVFLG